MEIEVGEYVRTKDGKIIKFKKFSKSRYSRYRGKDLEYIKTIIDNRGCHYKYDNIVKHSKNIIDLIEVGDYVNGKFVQDIIKTEKKHILYCEGEYVAGGIQKNEIKSIVTKEQFAQMEYKVKE